MDNFDNDEIIDDVLEDDGKELLVTNSGLVVVNGETFSDKRINYSNALAQARRKNSLLESKIEFLAIYKLKEDYDMIVKTDTLGHPYTVKAVKIDASELMTLTGKTGNGGSFYQAVKSAAIEMKSKTVVMSNDKTHQFFLTSLYGDVAYSNGVLQIEYTPESEEYFLSTTRYTPHNLAIAFSFQTNGGFQLYKYLKSFAWRLPEFDENIPQEKQPILQEKLTLSALRLALGYVDLDENINIQSEALRKEPSTDKYEKKPKYKRWPDFKKKVIDPGIEEVNKISEIYISLAPNTLGSHGKIKYINFNIQHNVEFYTNNANADKVEEVIGKTKKSKEAAEAYQVFNFVKEKTAGLHLSDKDINALINAANNDAYLIEGAIGRLNNSLEDVDNIVGYLIDSIKHGNYANSENKSQKSSGGKKAGTGFNDFSQHEYDYEELEKKLLSN